jgi:hypothetical protein
VQTGIGKDLVDEALPRCYASRLPSAVAVNGDRPRPGAPSRRVESHASRYGAAVRGHGSSASAVPQTIRVGQSLRVGVARFRRRLNASGSLTRGARFTFENEATPPRFLRTGSQFEVEADFRFRGVMLAVVA